jgi:hypothetical protein
METDTDRLTIPYVGLGDDWEDVRGTGDGRPSSRTGRSRSTPSTSRSTTP